MASAPQHIVTRYLQQRVLLLSLVLLALLFVLTAALSRAYHAREESLARYWSQLGDRDLSAHKPASAFEDYRNSLFYAPEDQDVQLHFAEALLADGKLTEARSYLANLWEHAPGSGEVNLDLAHVSIRIGDPTQADRYFRGAILGSWEGDSNLERRNARVEFYEYLLDSKRIDEARAVAAGIAADTPEQSGAIHEQNGHLLLRVGDEARALTEFETALQAEPDNAEWLAEAAKVAFSAGNYSKAETYFSRAVRENPTEELRASLALVADILRNDPFLAGLSEEEQARRTWRDFQDGLDRLNKCNATATNGSGAQASSDIDTLKKQGQELQKQVNLTALTADASLRQEVMQFLSQTEDVTAAICGPPTGIDQALKLLKRPQDVITP